MERSVRNCLTGSNSRRAGSAAGLPAALQRGPTASKNRLHSRPLAVPSFTRCPRLHPSSFTLPLVYSLPLVYTRSRYPSFTLPSFTPSLSFTLVTVTSRLHPLSFTPTSRLHSLPHSLVCTATRLHCPRLHPVSFTPCLGIEILSR